MKLKHEFSCRDAIVALTFNENKRNNIFQKMECLYQKYMVEINVYVSQSVNAKLRKCFRKFGRNSDAFSQQR